MIKKRNMAMQVVLYIVTFGIYGIYWYYVTTKEMIEYKKLQGSPGLWTFLLFIPLINLISVWQYGKLVEAFTEGKYNGVLVFFLWIIGLGLVVWALTQSELNARAGAAKA